MSDKSYVGLSDCFFCGNPKEIILDRRLRESLPRSAIYNMKPCDECKELMKQGIMFIEVRDGEAGKDNPFRTGQLWVLKEEAVKRFVEDPLLAQILKARFTLIEVCIANVMGLHQEAA